MTSPNNEIKDKKHKTVVLQDECARFIRLHRTSFPTEAAWKLSSFNQTHSGLIKETEFTVPSTVFDCLEEDTKKKGRWRVALPGATTLKQFRNMCARLPVLCPQNALNPDFGWMTMTAEEWADTSWMLPDEQTKHATSLAKRAAGVAETAKRHSKEAEARTQLSC